MKIYVILSQIFEASNTESPPTLFMELPYYLLQQLAFKESVDSGIMDCHRPPCYAFCVLIRSDFLREEPFIKQ